MTDTARRHDDLAALEAAVWGELVRAGRDKQHGWRVGVLATVSHGNDGAAEPEARSVVLREADAHARTLLVYTDARSPKAAQVAAVPRGVLVLWCRTLGWQLRLKLALVLETSGLAVSSRWAQLRMTPAAHDFLAPLPPGSVLEAPLTPSRSEREHFAMLSGQVQAIDWLELHSAGHRRAAFDADGRRWLVP